MQQQPDQPLTITPPRLEQAEEIAGMHAAIWRQTYENEAAGVTSQWLSDRTAQRTSPEGIAKYRAHITEALNDPEHHLNRVAYLDKDIVGLLHVKKHDNYYELMMLYVAVAQHGRGIAQALFVEYDAWARGLPIELEVVAYNQRAIRFYEKMGFVAIPGSDGLFADKLPTIKMIRQARP